MNFLLISGPKSCGKTSLIKRLFTHYSSPAIGYTVVNVQHYNGELRCILEKNGRRVMMQSDTDLPGCIKNLKDYYKANPAVNVIITACRNHPDPMRHRLFAELGISATGNIYFEVGLGRMPSGGARPASVAWYLRQMEKTALMVAAHTPFLL